MEKKKLTKDYIEGIMDSIDDDMPDGAYWQTIVDICQYDFPGTQITDVTSIYFEGEDT